MKRCCRCGETKDESEFHKRPTNSDGLYGACKKCVLADQKSSRESRKADKKAHHAAIHKESNLRRKYDMTLDEFQTRLEEQGAVCAICGRSSEGFQRAFAVDHNHETGVVRGILCPDCNRGLGGFRDNLGLLHKAVDYLMKTESQ